MSVTEDYVSKAGAYVITACGCGTRLCLSGPFSLLWVRTLGRYETQVTQNTHLSSNVKGRMNSWVGNPPSACARI